MEIPEITKIQTGMPPKRADAKKISKIEVHGVDATFKVGELKDERDESKEPYKPPKQEKKGRKAPEKGKVDIKV